MKTKIEKLRAKQIEKERDYIKEHEQIAGILVSVDGKTIDGRTFNAKKLGVFKFSKKYGMFYITGQFEHLIGYDTEPIVNAVQFEDYDSCYGSAAKGRIQQLENMDTEKLADIIGEIENKFNGLRVLFGELENAKLGSYHNPIYYNILRMVQGDAGDNHVKLSDFWFIKK